ncbi:hypothetical protein ABT236_30650 [Streptomyces sp. NPDC001523]|uniref:hypothetical protein n=1 Tax=Streptomyces sp. NPDC001523 TaxID=3154383 RepID=UPI003328CA6D
MTEITTRIEPHTVALSLIRATVLDEVARHPDTDGPPPNWEMYRGLTAALESWQRGGTLRADSLLLAQWLAIDLCAYLVQQLDRAGMERWLRDFGDEVCRAQRHAHPAGPTAIEILSVVTADLDARA